MMLARRVIWAFALATGCGDGGGGGDADVDAPSSGDASTMCSDAPGWSGAPAVRGGAIQETAVVALDGKVYVIGGFDAAPGVVDSVRVFDTATCSWSDGPSLPGTIHHANAAVAGDTIYVLGGMDGLGFTAIGDVFAWSPKTDAGWTTKTSMPAGSQRGSAFVGTIGDVIYVAGGLRNGSVATFSSYSTTNDSWDPTLPPLPQALDHGCGGVVGGKLYAIGGRNNANSALVFEYTPGGNWVQKASMPTARGGVACGVLDDRIIVAGGEGNPATASRVFAEVEVYTVSADRWDALPPMPTPRHGMGGAVSGGVFYVPGGATREGFGAVDTHEILRP